VIANEAVLAEGVRAAELKVQSALTKVDDAKDQLQKLQRRKILITGAGKALETIVEEAFKALGFEVEPGAVGRSDRVVRHTDLGIAILEIKGKSKSAAERDCAQLEKWISEHHIAHNDKAKPILVVNAWRELAVDKRVEAAFPHQMLEFATARGHCLITGSQLLCAWLHVEKEPAIAAAIRRELFDTVGCFGGYADSSSWIQVNSAPTETAKAK
jgi:hypothetical protein